MNTQSRIDADLAICTADVYDTAVELETAHRVYQKAQDDHANQIINDEELKKGEAIYTFSISHAQQRVKGIQEYLQELHDRKKDENRLGVDVMNRISELYYLVISPVPNDPDEYAQGRKVIRAIVNELRGVDHRQLESCVMAQTLADARTI
ncbi:MAG: hypothetical protein ACYC0V_01620 [Armatimonadota bacterium]